MAAPAKGWYQVAFQRDIVGEVTAASLGNTRLALVRQGGEIRAYDATCPHRGAHLAFGGRLEQNVIVCPFHGYRIHLGTDHRRCLSVPEYPVLSIGGMVFVRITPGHGNGWESYLEELNRTHFIISGFEMHARVPVETVIENAFDQRHFRAVHGVRTAAFVVQNSESGALIVESTFYLPTRLADGRNSVLPAHYRALVPSPGVSAVELRGPAPYTIITGATSTPIAGECVIRLSVAYPRSAWRTEPTPSVYGPLLEHSRRGLDDDRLVWENLTPPASPRWMPEDAPVRAFHQFCMAQGVE